MFSLRRSCNLSMTCLCPDPLMHANASPVSLLMTIRSGIVWFVPPRSAKTPNKCQWKCNGRCCKTVPNPSRCNNIPFDVLGRIHPPHQQKAHDSHKGWAAEIVLVRHIRSLPPVHKRTENENQQLQHNHDYEDANNESLRTRLERDDRLRHGKVSSSETEGVDYLILVSLPCGNSSRKGRTNKESSVMRLLCNAALALSCADAALRCAASALCCAA